MWGFWIINIIFGILAIYLLLLGLRGIILRRPFLFPARLLFWMFLLGFLPVTINSARFLFDNQPVSFRLIMLIPVPMFGTLLIFLWRQLRGYMVWGITDESLQDALHSALQSLNIQFEETISRVRLTSLGADLQVSVQSWAGTAQLRIKQPEHRAVLKDIAEKMNERFRSAPGKVNLTPSILYNPSCDL